MHISCLLLWKREKMKTIKSVADYLMKRVEWSEHKERIHGLSCFYIKVIVTTSLASSLELVLIHLWIILMNYKWVWESLISRMLLWRSGKMKSIMCTHLIKSNAVNTNNKFMVLKLILKTCLLAKSERWIRLKNHQLNKSDFESFWTIPSASNKGFTTF